MPGDHQQVVAGENIAQDVAVRKNCAEHQYPGDDSCTAHRLRRKHAVSRAECFADERACNAVRDGIHRQRSGIFAVTNRFD